MSFRLRRFLVLFTMGTVGILAVLPYQLTLVPLPASAPPLALVVVSVIVNGGIEIAISVTAGMWLASRCGLGTPVIDAALERQPYVARIRAFAPLAIVLGVVGSLIVIGLDVLVFAPQIPQLSSVATTNPPAWMGLLASLEGGMSEELLLRYFVMSLFVWLLMRLSRAPAMFWIANISAAVLFGLGHLPATAALLPLTPVVVMRAVVLNGLLGIAFGWLYWRRGLEAAMLSHFSADIVLHVITAAVARSA